MAEEVENAIRAFGMSGMQVWDELRSVASAFDIDLGQATETPQAKDDVSLALFEQSVRLEAAEMSRYYQLFYCLEKSIRKLIQGNRVKKYVTQR